MTDRQRLQVLGPVMGFFVVIAFGVGVIATAAFQDDAPSVGATSIAASDEAASNLLQIELGDLFIQPAEPTAAPGPLTIEVTNNGKTEHNFAVVGLGKTEMLQPGESATLEATVEAGTYRILCEVPGHEGGGMSGTLTVAGDGEAPEHSAHGTAGGMTAAEMVEHDAKVTGSFPAETKGRGNRILGPDVLGDGTKVYRLTADEVRWETEPGTFVEGYAYNGMIPGPRIEPELGDRVRIVLRNKLEQPTTLHLHGMTVPNAMDGVPVINQDAILPGDSFAYEFTVRNTGSNMYHSHFNAQDQVPKGLLGAFNVTDPQDPEVDLDYTMIVNDGPLGFTINGKGFPATEPLAIEKGGRLRIRYMNEGSAIHPMHLHGMPQRVIAIDGHLLDQPYMADTIAVAPGQRIDVLVDATEAGVWAFHCHILSHAEGPDGMFGMVTALIVE